MRPGAPSASTVLPAVDLDDGMPPPPWDAATPGGGLVAAGGVIAVGPGRPTPSDVAERAAERIATRVRRAFGLTNVLSAPLVAHDEILGVIVISRRRAPGQRRHAASWMSPRPRRAALARTFALARAGGVHEIP